ncbi:MAG: hypothetical protein FWD13_00060 [Treponema sp.]|nr:hypothetical protein [Treponema sp.]
MIQFQLYFLSILCNSLAGYVLFAGKDDSEKAPFLLKNSTFHLVLGILCTITGVLKLLAPIPYNVIILGDLFPSIGGITAGLLLIFGIYRQDNYKITDTQGAMDKLGLTLLTFRKPIAVFLFATSILHFLFPRAWLL